MHRPVLSPGNILYILMFLFSSIVMLFTGWDLFNKSFQNFPDEWTSAAKVMKRSFSTGDDCVFTCYMVNPREYSLDATVMFPGGTFPMNGGTIGGQFNMIKGNIAGNKAGLSQGGGGLYVCNSAFDGGGAVPGRASITGTCAPDCTPDDAHDSSVECSPGNVSVGVKTPAL